MSQIKRISVMIGKHTFPLQYSPSAGTEAMLREVFVNQAYPFLPYLNQWAGAILDVGANIGCVSILFGALYPKKTVYALEPSVDAFELLKLNTSPLPNVRIFHAGLHDRDGVFTLFHGQDSSVTNSIGASVHNGSASEQVSLRRASSFLADEKIEHISLLKLDTEGVELPILQDLRPWLDRVDAIFVEYHSEKDRLALDHLLSDRFILVHGRVHTGHRGVWCYVAKKVIHTSTDFNRREITPTA